MDPNEASNSQTVALPSESISQKDYNAVLEYYLDADSGDLDLVGLVAYALYKRQKREWIVKHRDMNAGKKPSVAEIAAVTTSYLTSDVRNTLRNRAAELLSSYANTYVEALEPGIRIDALSTETLRQAQSIEQAIRNKSGFWGQIWTGLAATAIWTLLVTGIVITASIFGSDIIDAWKASPKQINTEPTLSTKPSSDQTP